MWTKIFTAVRDLVLLGVGAFGIYTETMKDNPSVTVILAYAAVATSAGTLAALWLGRSGASEPTGSPSSSPPSSSSVSGP